MDLFSRKITVAYIMYLNIDMVGSCTDKILLLIKKYIQIENEKLLNVNMLYDQKCLK